MNILKTTALMVGLTLLLVLLGRAAGGPGGALAGLILAAVLNLGTWWFSDRIVLASSGAREVTEDEAPELHAMVASLAEEIGIPTPGVYIVPMSAPNAFATGRGPRHAAVAVTEGLLERMAPDEVQAVLAHELGHVVHRDTLVSSIAATLAGAIAFLARGMQWGLATGQTRRASGPWVLVAAVAAPIAAMLIQLAVSRSREYHADEYSAKILGSGEPLARALARLEEAADRHPTAVAPTTAHLFVVNPMGLVGGLAALFRTHPRTEDRIAHLRALRTRG